MQTTRRVSAMFDLRRLNAFVCSAYTSQTVTSINQSINQSWASIGIFPGSTGHGERGVRTYNGGLGAEPL